MKKKSLFFVLVCGVFVALFAVLAVKGLPEKAQTRNLSSTSASQPDFRLPLMWVGDEQALFSQCLRDMCGASKVEEISEVDPEDASVRDALEAPMKLVDEIIDLRVKYLEKIIGIGKEISSSGQKFNLLPEFALAASRIQYLLYLGAVLSNEEKARLYFKGAPVDFTPEVEEFVSEEHREAVLHNLHKFLFIKDYALLTKVGLKLSLDNLLPLLKPGFEPKEALESLAQDVALSHQMLNGSYSLLRQVPAVSLEILSGNFNNFDEKVFLGEVHIAMLFQLISKEKQEEEFVLGFDSQKNIKDFLDSPFIIASRNILEDEDWLSGIKVIERDSSERSLLFSFSNQLAQVQKDEFLKSVQVVKNQVKQRFRFSNPNLRRRFEKEVDELTIQTPQTKAETQSFILQVLQSERDALAETVQKLESASLDQDLFSKFFLEEALLFDGESWGEPENDFLYNAFNDLDQAVSLHQNVPLSDHAFRVYGDGLVNISWYVIHHKNEAFGVFLHELGHAVSYILKEMGEELRGDYYLGVSESFPLWEERRCVADFYQEPQIRRSKPGEESQMAEEDWADFFAARMAKDLSRNPDFSSLKNMACLFFDFSGSEEDLSLLPSLFLDYQTGQVLDVDTHSSNLTRLIHIEREMKGGLSESCQRVVDEHDLLQCGAGRRPHPFFEILRPKPEEDQLD